MKRLARPCITAAFLTASAVGGPVAPATSVQVSVTAAEFGIGWTQLPSAGLVVRVADFDGRNDTFAASVISQKK